MSEAERFPRFQTCCHYNQKGTVITQCADAPQNGLKLTQMGRDL